MAKMKTKTKSKKTPHYPTKKGINLIQNSGRAKRFALSMLVTLLVFAALALLIKFGVLDVIEKRFAAQEEYDLVHLQYATAQAELSRYDDVLMEYRTYSMDWLDGDNSGKYVTVDRRDVLDLIQSKMMKKGKVVSVVISGETANVEMSGLDMTGIAKMCADLETSPIVSTAVFQSGGTDEDSLTGSLNFKIMIRLQSPKEEQEG